MQSEIFKVFILWLGKLHTSKTYLKKMKIELNNSYLRRLSYRAIAGFASVAK